MAWVTGIKQVTIFQPERDGKQAIPKPVRVVSSLLPHAIEGTIQLRTILAENTGAGPCGTHARARAPACDPDRHLPPGCYQTFPRRDVASPLAWSIVRLIGPLQAWYALQNRPRDPLSRAGIQIGAKSGGGNGRCELW